MTIGMFVVALVGSLMLAAFYHDYDWSLGFVWALVIGIPLITAGITYYVSKATYADPYFDPTSEDAPAVSSPGMEIFQDDAYQSASYSDRLTLTLSEAEALADHLDEADRDEAYAKVESIRRRLDIMSRLCRYQQRSIGITTHFVGKGLGSPLQIQAYIPRRSHPLPALGEGGALAQD